MRFGFNQEIERIRGVGVLVVVFGHLEDYYDFGFGEMHRLAMLIDLFFVISGLMIGTQAIKWLAPSFPLKGFRNRFNASKSALKAFFIRRALRILPLCVVWALGGLAMLYVDGRAPFQLLREGIAIFGFHVNFAVIANPRIFFGYFWSLSVEEQFYILFPFLLLALPFVLRRKKVILSLIVLWVTVRAGLIFAGIQYVPYFNTRYGGLLVGYYLALKMWDGDFNHIVFNRKRLIQILTLILISAPLLIPRQFGFSQEIKMLRFEVAILLYGVVVGLAALNQGYTFSFGKLNKLVEAIGTRSYGLYLGHVVIYHFVRHMWNPPIGFWGQVALVFVLLAVTMEFGHRLIEKPLRDLGYRLTPRK